MGPVNDQMEALKDCVGREVKCLHSFYGHIDTEAGTLKEYTPYVNATVGCLGIPFIGYGSAIHLIECDGKTIYHNPHLPYPYDSRDDAMMDYYKALSFGYEISQQHKRQRLEYEEKRRKEVEEQNAAARDSSAGLIAAGLPPLVKPETVEDWKRFAENNTQDGYSCAVVKASVAALAALSEGKTPKEAEDIACDAEGGLTGYMMGCVAKTLAFFSPRGEEFRQHWNRQYLKPEQADATDGVVNPAILTIAAIRGSRSIRNVGARGVQEALEVAPSKERLSWEDA